MAAGVALVALGAAYLNGGRWQGPLYCISRPGQLWAGRAGTTPTDAVPDCPASDSYRREVRSGQSQVELYRLPGWQPRALLEQLKRAGYAQETDDPINPGTYSAFLRRGTERVQYLATREGATTLVTLSGRPTE